MSLRPAMALSFTTVRDVGTSTVSLTGLNSAWRSTEHHDYGRLVLGMPQFENAARVSRDANVRIALVHHPLDTEWYSPWERLYHQRRMSMF